MERAEIQTPPDAPEPHMEQIDDLALDARSAKPCRVDRFPFD